jgi:hypothetical protein
MNFDFKGSLGEFPVRRWWRPTLKNIDQTSMRAERLELSTQGLKVMSDSSAKRPLRPVFYRFSSMKTAAQSLSLAINEFHWIRVFTAFENGNYRFSMDKEKASSVLRRLPRSFCGRLGECLNDATGSMDLMPRA